MILKKLLPVLVLAAVFLSLFIPTASAVDEAPVGEAEIMENWEALIGSLPPEVADLLPDGFFEGNAEGLATGAKKAGALGAILKVIGDLTGAKIGACLSLLALLVGILLLSALLKALTENGRESLTPALSLSTTLVITLLIFNSGVTGFAEIAGFFEVVRTLSVALIPLMGALYAMGGNVGAAVANHGVMSGFLAISEAICSGAVLPIATVLVAMALLDAVSDRVGLAALAALIKRTFTLGLSFLMMLLCFILGLQTTLAKGADTLALRTARFAAGSFLPIVGSSVGEALRTVAGSVQYLRGAVGVGGILLIFFAFLPTFLSVLCTKLTLGLASAVAGLLSCKREERLLSELSGVWGYFLAVIAALFVMMVFSLTLLARCATAG